MKDPAPVAAPASDGARRFTVVDAIVAGDRLIALADDGSVVARELDGVEVWRAQLGPTTPGPALIQRLPGAPRVLVRRPGRLVALDLHDGRVAARSEVELEDRLYLWARDGACGLRGQCSMQLVDCGTGRPLGAAIEGQIHHESDPDGGASSGCWGFDLDLVGRAGEVVVYLADDSGAAGGHTAFGVSAQDGARVWSSAAVACRFCSNESFGMSPGGTWCFAVENEVLSLFACRTGEVRGARKVAAVRRALWVGDEGGGIFVDSPSSAALLDPAKNTWRWQAKLPADALAVPRRARLTDLADISYRQDKPTPLLVLDEDTGQVVTRMTLDPDGAIAVAADGSVSVTNNGQDRDHTGQVLPSILPAPVVVDRSHLPASSSGPPNHAVVRRTDGTIVATIDADAWPLGWTRSGDEVRLAVMISSTPRTVALYRFNEKSSGTTTDARSTHNHGSISPVISK